MITHFIRMAGRITIAVFSLALALFIIFDLALAGGVVWLNSAAGQEWAKPKLEAALAKGGYKLSYNILSYSLSDGLVVTDFKLGDADGEIVEIDYAAVRLNVVSIAARRVGVALNAHRVILHRLPAGEEKDDDEGQEFALPALDGVFIRTLLLNHFMISRLELREPVLGKDMVLFPRFSGRLTLFPDLHIVLNGRIGQEKKTAIAWIPRSLSLDGRLDRQTMLADLSALSVMADAYQIQASGRVGLGAYGENSLTVNASGDDLSLLLDGQDGTATFVARLTGPAQDPVLAVEGRATLEPLVQKGLSEILLTLDAEGIKTGTAGGLSIATHYHDAPLSLSALFAYDADAVTMHDLALTGPGLAGTGQLKLNRETKLADGMLTLDADDIALYADLAGQDISGKASATLSLSAADKHQAAQLIAAVKNGRYQEYVLDSADIIADIEDIKNPFPQALTLSLRGASLGHDGEIDRLDAQLKEAKDGHGHGLTLSGEGNFARPFRIKGSAYFADLEWPVPAIRDLDMALQSDGSAVNLQGALSGDEVDLSLSITDFNPAVLSEDFPVSLKNMRLTGQAAVTGGLAAPQIRLDLLSNMLALTDSAPYLQFSAKADYHDGVAGLVFDGQGEGIRLLTGRLSVPLSLSFSPYSLDIRQDAALDGAFQLDLEGKALSDAFLPPDHSLTGAVRGTGRLAGTRAQPDLRGTVTLRAGTYDYAPYQLGLRDLVLDAELTKDRMILQSLSAVDQEGGSLKAEGVFGLAHLADTNISLSLDKFHLIKSTDANGRASADLTLSGKENSYLASGRIDIDQLDIVIPEQFQAKIPQLNIVEGDKEPDQILQDIVLDIALHAKNQIFVRGWGLDAELGGALVVTGTLDAPQINGEFQSIRGRYEEFGRRFSLAHATLRFQGAIPPSPYLDIEATTALDSMAASVLLTGSVTAPKIAFSSRPALPEDEVVAHILFGQGMGGISPFQAFQLAQTLQRFSGHGGGGFDPLGQLRSITGLDDIRVDTSESGESTIGVGKYLTDNVYLEVQAGAGEGSGAANLQIELTPSITLESKIGQDAQSGAGIFWGRDY